MIDVFKVENTDRDSNVETRRGREREKTYTNEFKHQVILEARSDALLYDIDVAGKYETSKYLIPKWKRNRDAFENAATQTYKKPLEKIRPSTRHQELFRKLRQKFPAPRTKGLEISYEWFYANANKINKEIRRQRPRRLPKSVVSRFINAYKM